MSNPDGQLEIRILEMPDRTAAIKLIRKFRKHSLAEIGRNLVDKRAFIIATLYGLDHAEQMQTVVGLLADLDHADIQYKLRLGQEVESAAYLFESFNQWRKSELYSSYMAVMESGSPDIETLMWLQATSSAEIFQTTLQQIATGEQYAVDAETLTWVKQQLDYREKHG